MQHCFTLPSSSVYSPLGWQHSISSLRPKGHLLSEVAIQLGSASGIQQICNVLFHIGTLRQTYALRGKSVGAALLSMTDLAVTAATQASKTRRSFMAVSSGVSSEVSSEGGLVYCRAPGSVCSFLNVPLGFASSVSDVFRRCCYRTFCGTNRFECYNPTRSRACR